MAVVLLIETKDGNVVAVRFPDNESARDWEDEHDDEVSGRGVVTLVSKGEALDRSR